MKKKHLLFLIFVLLCIQEIFSQNAIVRYYENGNIKYQGFLKDTILDSTYTSFHEDGTVKEIGSFKDCTYKKDLIKITRYSVCGKEKLEDNVYLGKKNGEWYSYYESGNIKAIENYECNIEDGSWISFFESGVTQQTHSFSAGKLIYAEKFNEDATLIEILRRDYRFDRKNQTEFKIDHITLFYENGVEQENYSLDNNDDKVGHYKTYWINGVLREEGKYIKNKKSGIIKKYDEVGDLIKEIYETDTK